MKALNYRFPWLAGLLLGAIVLWPQAANAKLLTISGRVTSGVTGVSGVNAHVVCDHVGYDKNFTTDANGYYTATEVDMHTHEVYDHHYYIVTFSKTGYAFSPGSINVEVPTDSPDITGQDAIVGRGPCTGQVTSGGLALPGVTVSQVRSGTDYWDYASYAAQWPNANAIPDNNSTGLYAHLYVGTKGTITGLNLVFAVDHGRYLDLVVKLRHPDGSEIVFYNQNWDHAPGAYAFYKTSSDFNNKSSEGIYYLIVQDRAASYTGSLLYTYLHVNTSTTTAANGNYDLGTVAVKALVTPAKSGVTFSPTSSTMYPGVPANFTGTGPIQGYVRSGNNHGVSGVTVTKGTATRTTDANGLYSFGNGNAATGVAASKTSHTFTPSSQTIYPAVDANFTVVTGTISGRVRTGSTTGLSGVTITATSGGTTQQTTTGTDGSYTFASMSGTSDWTLTAAKFGFTFTGSQTTFAGATGVDFTVALGTIGGQVLSGTTGLSGVTLTATRTGQSNKTTTTDINGSYALTNLDGSADWTVTPSKSAWTFNPSSTTTYPGAANVNFSLTQSPPTISGLTNRTIAEEGLASLNFQIADYQTPLANLTLTDASSNTGLIPTNRIWFSGSGGTRTLTLFPVPNGNGTATITVTVKDGNNQTASASFTLTVTAVNDPPVVGGGAALRFDGTNDYVGVPAWALPTNEITVEFWQKVEEARAQSTFIAITDATTSRLNAHVPWSDGKVYWDFGNMNSGGRLSYTPSNSIAGTWHHWALVSSKSGNFMRIYRNGVLEASSTTASSRTAVDRQLYLGVSQASQYFKGDLGEFRIWNVARTQSEIQTNMNRTVPTNSPNLLVYYRFTEGSGTTLRDLASLAGSGSTNQLGAQNGTLYNSPAWVTSVVDGPPKETRYVLGEGDSKTFGLPAYDVDNFITQLQFANVVVTTGAVRRDCARCFIEFPISDEVCLSKIR